MKKQVCLALMLFGLTASWDGRAESSLPRPRTGNVPNESLKAARPTTAADAQSEFSFPEPTEATRGRRLTLWATFYYVATAKKLEGGQPLLAMNGRSLGVSLSARDWCSAAMEGTVSVMDGAAPAGTFNYSGRGPSGQVDCAPFYPHVERGTQKALGRTRFETSGGPFGTGVRGLILVPYRTIAVDSSQTPIPFGTVVYVPEARGKAITLPSGEVVKHDGYFFAADSGKLIKGVHIDVFGGVSTSNPFPGFVKSKETETFTAYIVNDAQIAESLKRTHQGAR
jgi:3D (Asp-Asp-Asp) domain-containing protein